MHIIYLLRNIDDESYVNMNCSMLVKVTYCNIIHVYIHIRRNMYIYVFDFI